MLNREGQPRPGAQRLNRFQPRQLSAMPEPTEKLFPSLRSDDSRTGRFRFQRDAVPDYRDCFPGRRG